MERTIRIADATPVPWPAIREKLIAVGELPAMRMIDGELAFPDEEPPAGWKELRISLSGGMATLRRTPQEITCVTWGNADGKLVRSWNLLAWAVASATDGLLLGDGAERTSVEFARLQKLFPD